jgi:hypothetical protein
MTLLGLKILRIFDHMREKHLAGYKMHTVISALFILSGSIIVDNN